MAHRFSVLLAVGALALVAVAGGLLASSRSVSDVVSSVVSTVTSPQTSDEAYTAGAAACSLTGTPGEALWSYEAGGGFGGSVAINGNILYFGTFHEGSNFYALREDGTLLWKTDIGMSVESSPALGPDGTIYADTFIPSGGSRSQATFQGFTRQQLRGTIALDPADGTILWGSGNPENGSDGAPAVSADGTVVYAATVTNAKLASKDPSVKKTGGMAYAFDAKTGEVIWSIPTRGWGFASPAVSPIDGTIYFGTESDAGTSAAYGGKGGVGELLAVAPDGEVLWTYQTDSEIGGSPNLLEDKGEEFIVFRTQLGVVYRLDRDGDLMWKTDLEAQGLGTTVLGSDNARVYVTTAKGPGENNAQLIAIDSATGEVAWGYRFSNAAATPIVGDKAVYVISEEGEFIAVSEEGEELWTLELNSPIHTGHIALNSCGVAYVLTDDGMVHAVQTESSGLSPTSSWPSYRATERASGLPNGEY